MKKAVIFDMDGVISDTQDLHSEIESNILKRCNVFLTPDEITARFAGVGDRAMFASLFKENDCCNIAIAELISEKWRCMTERTKDGKLKAIPHALDLIKLLKRNDFLLAVASGSPRHFILHVIKTLGIKESIDYYLSAEEVKRGKPAPDIFLEVAKRLAVKPRQCVVIEDALSGMIAAARAGMPCIGLVKEVQGNCPASLRVTSLAEITLQMIDHLGG